MVSFLKNIKENEQILHSLVDSPAPRHVDCDCISTLVGVLIITVALSTSSFNAA
jgi:hypothetical protein